MDIRRISGGYKVDKWWIRIGGVAKANNTRRLSGGYIVDTWPEHIMASLFFLRKKKHNKLNYTNIDPDRN